MSLQIKRTKQIDWERLRGWLVIVGYHALLLWMGFLTSHYLREPEEEPMYITELPLCYFENLGTTGRRVFIPCIDFHKTLEEAEASELGGN